MEAPTASPSGPRLKLRPKFAEAHYNLGQIYLERGENAKAIAAFNAAIAANPQYEAAIAAAAGAVEPMVELSDVLVSLERPGEAHLVLKRAEYFAPTNLTVRSRLARLSEKLGHLADAEEHLRYLASNGTNVRRNLTLLARFYARRGAPKESQAVLSLLQRDMRGGWTLPPAVGQFPGEALPGDPDPGQPGSSDG